MYKPIDFDVVIIGGGLSGLTAAYHLLSKEPSLDVIIFESREIIGGRLFSVPLLVKDGKYVSYFAVTGQYVGSEQNYLLELCKKLDVTVFANQKKGGKIILEYETKYIVGERKSILKFLSTPDKIELTKFILKVETLCHEVREKSNANRIEELSKITLKYLIQNSVKSEAAEAIIDYMVFFNCGVNSSQISALFYVFFCISTRGVLNQLLTEESKLHEFKIKNSAHHLCDKIAREIGRESILTGERVLEVKCTEHYVEVKTIFSTYCCQYVIVAVAPEDILKMKFSPPLPQAKIESLNKTCTNRVTSFVVTYPRDFWSDKGFSGEVCILNKRFSQRPIDFCSSVYQAHKPALLGWIFGGRISDSKFPIYKKAVLLQLSEYFGVEALHPTDYYEKSWYNNTSRMICWKVGNTTYINDIKKSTDRIFWAGAETSSEWYGQLAGAVNSGMRAALEVLYDLRPGLLTPDDLIFLSPTQRSLKKPFQTYDRNQDSPLGYWKYYVPIGILVIIIIWKLKDKYLSE